MAKVDQGGMGLGRMPPWLRDAIRGGAEGAVTGTLGGPVDLATMAMRPLGYDVEKPVMGSEWIRDRMQDAGVYGERTGTPAEQAGEFIGAIAAPGPDPLQYAGIGLGLGGMIRAYHGSPHSFDKFDMSKIGTGEGAQAYGHGLYFAESPEVARSYQSGLTHRANIDNKMWRPPDDLNPQDAEDADSAVRALNKFFGSWGSPSEMAGELRKNLDDTRRDVARGRLAAEEGGRPPPWLAGAERELAELEPAVRALDKYGVDAFTPPHVGATYTVDLDVEPDDLLDWDRPLSQQSEKVKAAIYDVKMPGYDTTYGQVLETLAADPRFSDTKKYPWAHPTGSEIYHGFARSKVVGNKAPGQTEASIALRAAGIPGIRYLDGGSRSAGEGTHNFVLFDDSKAKIVERK